VRQYTLNEREKARRGKEVGKNEDRKGGGNRDPLFISASLFHRQ
jgi:hypothetical protein